MNADDLIVMFLTGTPEQREDAASELYPMIRRIARRVVQHRPVGKQCKCDFEEEMPAETLGKVDHGAFDPAKGRFDAWCFVVLRNRYKDWIDQWVRQHGHEQTLPPGGPELPGPPPKPCADEPFSVRELALLEKMRPKQRVICVSVAGWPPRVPADDWQQWLAKAGIEPPFPPVEIFDIDEPTKRIPLLASALGVNWTAVWQHWFRGRRSEPFREVGRG